MIPVEDMPLETHDMEQTPISTTRKMPVTIHRERTKRFWGMPLIETTIWSKKMPFIIHRERTKRFEVCPL